MIVELLTSTCSIQKLAIASFGKSRIANDLPPVIPLRLWRGCYELGSPITLIEEDIQKLRRTFTNIKIILIAEESYHAWYFSQTFNPNGISDDDLVATLINPIS